MPITDRRSLQEPHRAKRSSDESMSTTLRELRLMRGWSQDYLAYRAGVSRRTIVRLESGEAPNVVARYLARVARVFSLSISAMFPELELADVTRRTKVS